MVHATSPGKPLAVGNFYVVVRGRS